MIRNYFKIAWRNLLREKAYAFMNVIGLAIGITGATLILLWAVHEKSYDRFFSKADRTYQLWSQLPVDGKVFSFEYSPEILASSLQKNIPEIEHATSYVPIAPTSYALHNRKLNLATAAIDSAFFNVFDFAVIQGNPNTIFENPYSLILTEKTAKVLFGNEQALGKWLNVGELAPLEVTAILQDLPTNTAFHFDVLLPQSLGKIMGHISDDWDSFEAETFIVPQKEVSEPQLTQQIRSFMHPHKSDVAIDLYALPLTKRHLQANFEDGHLVGGKIVLVHSFILVAFLLLGVASINFMNLSTARSEKRAVEVGIRKVSGASRSSLIAQFLIEAMLLTFLSSALALLIIFSLLPFFNDFIGQQLSLPFNEPSFWTIYIGFSLIIGLFSGSYPAFFLSSFQSARVLKRMPSLSRSGISLRRILSITQFTIAITLIISTILIYQQIRHAQNRHSGYDRSQLLFLSLSDVQQRNFPAIKQALLANHIATSVSKTFAPVTDPEAIGSGYTWEGFTEKGTSSTLFTLFATEADLLQTVGIRLLAGRDLDITRFPTDSGAVLVNESAAKAMNMPNPIGKWIARDGKRWHIVGLVKDFVLESPFQKIKPLFITGPFTQMSTLHIKLANQQNTADALNGLKDILKSFDHNAPFAYHFVEEVYAQKFNEEQLTAKLSLLFTGLTIFISCLGLFGLAAYMAERRRKEIGVRKVLGATVASIVQTLSEDFVKLVAIACIVASPIAYYIMNSWLEDFHYRINIGWQVFALTYLLASCIALCSVGFQAIKAALANPVDSLRND